MASQTGSIDLTASNSVKLAAEAGWQSDLDSYYTKSEIDVTVGGINSTVSTKVGEDEVISSINQSSESVSINANKINLTGTVTISDLASDASGALTDAAKTATNYVTPNGDNAITVHPKRSNYATTGGRAVINASGLTIYLNSDDVASYGTSARIGKANSDRVTVDSTNGITIYKGNSKRLQTTANGIDVYGSDGTTSIASFGSTVTLASEDNNHLVLDGDGLAFLDQSDNRLFYIDPYDGDGIPEDSSVTLSTDSGWFVVSAGGLAYLTVGSDDIEMLVKKGSATQTALYASGSEVGVHQPLYAYAGLYVTGSVHSTYGVYPSDDLAGLAGTDSYIYLKASSDEHKWRFSKSNHTVWWYDGTDWDPVCPMPAMTAAISGGTDKSLTTSYANLNLAAVTTVGSTLTISGGGVKCAKAGRVMLSASAYFSGFSAANVCNLRILLGTTVAAFVNDRAVSDRCQLTIPPRITTVSAGDVIYMAVANTSTAAGVVDGNRVQTWLTVQYVAYN